MNDEWQPIETAPNEQEDAQWRMLTMRLNALRDEYHQRAQPIIEALARSKALQPPAPIIIDDPRLIESIRRQLEPEDDGAL